MKPEISDCLAVNRITISDEDDGEEELESLQKEQQPGKKRSGAQKRKLRMLRAIAAGEQVVTRSERSRRGKVAADSEPGSVASPASGLPEVSPGAEAARPDSGRSAGGGQAAARGGPPAPVRLAVVCRGFPSVKMTAEQHEALQDALLDRVELAGGGQPLQVSSTRCGDGAAYFDCANEWTAAWLREVVPDLSPWEGARLKVGPANAVMRLAKVLVWIPKPTSRKGTPEILSLLQKQNIGVPATEWKAVSRKDADDGAALVFVVDEKSYRALRGYKFKLYLSMGQVTFKILARPPGFN